MTAPGPDLTSCWARFSRGDEHMQALEASIAEWARKGPYAFRHQSNGERTRFSLIADERTPPDLPRWALLACEAFANLRCSLDHAIWAAGEHEGAPADLEPRLAKTISFPIADQLADFELTAPKSLRGLSSAVRMAVEAFQPYKRPHPELPPLLAVLRHVDNVNKHRLILPVCQVAGMVGTRVTNINPPIRAEDLKVEVALGPVGHDSEVLALVTSSPQPSVVTFNAHIELGASLEIANGGNTSPRFRNVRVLFNEIAAEVKEVIEAVAVACQAPLRGPSSINGPDMVVVPATMRDTK